MAVQEATAAERRAPPRYAFGVDAGVKVSIGVLGSKPLEGEVLDVSRGGAKIRLLAGGQGMKKGKSCLVMFRDAEDEINPPRGFATVRRVVVGRLPSVAVEFEAPLDVLNLPPPLAS